jgi:hypothetical protein
MNTNRWLLLSLAFITCPLTFAQDKPSAEEAGFVSLFDGKTLSGWKGSTGAYIVENGAIVCVAGGRGNLLTEKEFADFDLRFEFKLTPGANNGLGIRSPLSTEGNLHLEGIELQIIDDTAEKYKTLQPYQFHGSIYGLVPAKTGSLKPVGQWNQQQVIARGPRIQVIVNGTTIINANLEETLKTGTLDGQAHPGASRKKGHLGFLGHGDRIEVRNIRIKEIVGGS